MPNMTPTPNYIKIAYDTHTPISTKAEFRSRVFRGGRVGKPLKLTPDTIQGLRRNLKLKEIGVRGLGNVGM